MKVFMPLTQGKVATVDLEDWERMNTKYKWQAQKSRNTFYAIRSISLEKGRGCKKRTERMHRIIMGAKQGQIIDHIDGNGLNNTRENLRFVTLSENQRNRRPNKNSYSGYKGVVKGTYNKWYARIFINGETKFLGSFNSEIEAAVEYDKHAKKHYGEYAKLNLNQG